MVEVIAKLRYLQMAPRKVRLVADLIRGMNVIKAKSQLAHLPKRSALPLAKLLDSCIANATHNFDLKQENLRIAQLRVDGGPMLKRQFARSRGRADIKHKRMSHITLVLSEKSHGTKDRS